MLRGLELGNYYSSITECQYDQVRPIVDLSGGLKHN